MSENEVKTGGWVIYPIGSKPKMGLSILLGVQQYLTMFGATVLIPFIIGGAMGMPQDQLALLISTMFFCSGITTLIQQSPIGNKLPIIQGGTFSLWKQQTVEARVTSLHKTNNSHNILLAFS